MAKIAVKSFRLYKSKTSRPSTKIKSVASKTKLAKAKAGYIDAKRALNIKRGGIRGAYARHRLVSEAKAKSKAAFESMKPDLKGQALQTEMKTKAQVKAVKAKSAGAAAVASALGGSYSIARTAESAAKKEIERTKQKAIDAYNANLASDLTTPSLASNVTGLTQGVK